MTVTRSDDEEGSRAPSIVEERSANMFEEAGSILGDRLAEGRVDPDRGVRVTVIDLNDDDDDVAALHDAATRLGIGDWLRLDRSNQLAEFLIKARASKREERFATALEMQEALIAARALARRVEPMCLPSCARVLYRFAES